MRNGYFPIFSKGRVLKKESIEYLRDFPYDLASLALENYSDGILFGFSITSSGDGKIHISKGALKHQGGIIVIPDQVAEMNDSDYGVFLYTKMVVGECNETVDCLIRNVELVIDRHEVGAGNEIELGRFCLHRGAVLRCVYDSFVDLRTPNDTMDLTHVPFASYGAPSLHPVVMKEYAKALLTISRDAADTSFALMCMNTGVMHKGCVQWHIAKKTGKEYTDFTLPMLYEKLLSLLPQSGIKGVVGPRRTSIL